MKTTKLTIGILAHVDAGKTTLAESMLFCCGNIKKAGRVDHKDAFLDTYMLEKARGITIFSKQAELSLGGREVTLLDTPGHTDFSAETERTLAELDYAILVISAADGVQGHTKTLWELLKRYNLPVFIFVNKMDQEGADRQALMEKLKNQLGSECVNFSDESELLTENIAASDEALLERYLENEMPTESDIQRLVASRRVYPCFFGSALRLTGIEEFILGLKSYTVKSKEYPDSFGASVYKISRDEQNNRLTHIKITGGRLSVKMQIGEGDEAEKINEIRIYSGSGYRAVKEAEAGTICAVTGLSKSYAGQGLGCQGGGAEPLLQPVMSYKIILPQGCELIPMLAKLRMLEEEIPELNIEWKENISEIHARVMGEIQTEIIKNIVKERFFVDIDFGEGSVLYKETIAEEVEGIGHYEPLRHYSEVHIIISPAKRGSGVHINSICSEDNFGKSWQRLVLTHLAEKKHIGVLTGSEITDVTLTLAAGAASIKHSEGGDFREATYRAVRQGLKSAKSILLEPIYAFTLEVPAENLGRAMADIQRLGGSFGRPYEQNETAVLSGKAPVYSLQGYAKEVTAYTRGQGRLSCSLCGYEPCHNTNEIIEKIGYDFDKDLENPASSIFCAHGAGFYVNWDEVRQYMHLPSALKPEKAPQEEEITQPFSGVSHISKADEKELEAIYAATYYKNAGRDTKIKKSVRSARRELTYTEGNAGQPAKEKYLLVDGYNIIFSWEELRRLAEVGIDLARNRLADMLSGYKKLRKGKIDQLILVFDAYKVKEGRGSIESQNGIYIVYTKEAETADQYIEKTVHNISRKYSVSVATSDGAEQIIIMGQGAYRVTSSDLYEDVMLAEKEISEYIKNQKTPHSRISDNIKKQSGRK